MAQERILKVRLGRADTEVVIKALEVLVRGSDEDPDGRGASLLNYFRAGHTFTWSDRTGSD